MFGKYKFEFNIQLSAMEFVVAMEYLHKTVRRWNQDKIKAMLKLWKMQRRKK